MYLPLLYNMTIASGNRRFVDLDCCRKIPASILPERVFLSLREVIAVHIAILSKLTYIYIPVDSALALHVNDITVI